METSLPNISDSEQSSSSIIEGAISAEEFLHRERERLNKIFSLKNCLV